MAVSSIAVPPDAARDARARALAPSVQTWPVFTLKQPFGSFEAGTQFRQAPGSTGAHYLVNAVACACPDYQQSGNICKHIRAVVLFEARQQPTPARPKPLRRYEDLFFACADDCGEIVERKGARCDRCDSAEVRRLDDERRRHELATTGRTGTDVIPLNLPE